MNRRAFLATLSAALAGVVLDPERLLWRPGAKTIFIPSGVHFNTLITPEWVMREMFGQLQNNLRFTNAINRQYDNSWVNGSGLVPIGKPFTVSGRYLVN